jgi:Flp pilus assembly protein TadG
MRNLRKNRKGQAALETALILLVFLATLIGAMDFAQILFVQQSLTERTRAALRWGVVRAWDGSGDQIANYVMYGQSTAPVGDNAPPAFLGLTRANVQVTYTPPPAGGCASCASPEGNDEWIRVAIVNYQYRFFSPWIAGTFTNNNAVVMAAPMAYKD